MNGTEISQPMLAALEVAGTLAFALSGALLARRKGLDIVGVASLALAAGLAGGIVRDVLVGQLPPRALQTNWHLVVPLVAVGLSTNSRISSAFRAPVVVFDAVGLGLFSVAGAWVAVDRGLGLPAATLVGVLSAAGGGITRDVLVREVPQVFTPDSGLYVIPAAAGGVVVGIAAQLGAPAAPTIGVVAACLVTAARLLSLRLGWSTRRFDSSSEERR